MSVHVMTVIWGAADIDSTAMLVLARMALFADCGGGSIFPSIARLSEDTRLSERAVRNALRRLEGIGVLKVVKQEDAARHRPREYCINLSYFEGGTRCRAERDAGGHEVPGGTSCQSGGHLVPFRGAPSAPNKSDINHIKNNARSNEHERQAKTGLEADFERWYAKYPRHVGRGQALKAYRVARRKTDAETLLTAAERFAATAAGTDPKYVPHPATWLNAERWLDETAAAAAKPRPQAADWSFDHA